MIAVSTAEPTMDTTLTRPLGCLRKAPFVAALAVTVCLARVGRPAAAASDGHQIRFMRMVVGCDKITVAGSEATLDQLEALFAKVAEPQHTILEVAASSKEIEPPRLQNAVATVDQLCRRLGFREVRQIDPCPLDSKARKVGFVGPPVYGKIIPLGLRIGTDEYPEMMRAMCIRLKRKWFKVKADVDMGWLTCAAARWRTTLELLDGNRQVLAEGQQTFVTYRRAHGRFLGGGQALSFDLGRWADVRAAREFVVTVAKIPEEKFEVTGKEYPKDESPVLKGLEWGEADGKTRCRLRLNQRVWQEQETPVVLADVLHRGGGRGVSLRRSPSDFELELNGVWYSRQGKPDEARWRLAGRHNYDEAIAIPLDGHWQSKEDGTALQIADGRHTVRLAFVLECLDDPDRLFRAVSGPVQIFCGPRAIEAYEALQEDGQKILGEMVRANRHWLIGPPETVKTYAYDFVRWDKKRVRAQITVGANVASSSRQGIRFRIPLHALANEPSRAVVTAIERQGAHIVLRYDLGQATKAEIGNGHRPGQTWRCCRSYYASRGAVWVDASRHVPVRTEGRLGLEIRFLDYVSLGEGGYAPKRIRFKDRKSRWGWRFATYSPGLWLFERGGPRYGMIGLFMKSVKVYVCNVTVNGQPARPLR